MSDILHLEDFVLTGDVVAPLDQFRRSLCVSQFCKGQQDVLKIKFDGSPAFVFGKLSGQNIIATKSFFNKTPKFYSSVDEIKESDLSLKLKNVLIEIYEAVHWPTLTDGMLYQGDFLKSSTDMSVDAWANVLQYWPIPAFTLVVSVHTLYQVTHSGDLVETKIVHSPKNLFMSAHVVEMYAKGDVKSETIMVLGKLISMVEDFKLDLSPRTYDYTTKYLVSLSRLGMTVESLGYVDFCSGMIKFLAQEYLVKYESLKKRETQEHWHRIFEEIKAEFMEKSESIYSLVKTSEGFKRRILQDFNGFDSVKARATTSDGLNFKLGHEGLVAYIGTHKVKLINRDQFSHYNLSSKYLKAFTHRRD